MAKHLLQDPQPDLNSVILYGNESSVIKVYFDTWLMKMFDLEQPPHKTKLTFNGNDDSAFPYESSAFHFEIPYHDKCHLLIKSIASNRNVCGRRFVFFIKNVSGTARLGKLVEKYSGNALFVWGCRSLPRDSITNHSMLINLAWEKTIPGYDNTKSVFRNLDGNAAKDTQFEKALKSLVDNIKKNTQHKNVSEIREFVYKVGHLVIPFHIIAKTVIDHLSNHPKIYDIVALAAQCDTDTKMTSKDLMVYEKFFLNLCDIL